MDSNDRHVLIEQQRAETLGLIRHASAAIVLAVGDHGQLITAYFNLTPIERRGLIELMQDTAPHFYPTDEDDDEDD